MLGNTKHRHIRGAIVIFWELKAPQCCNTLGTLLNSYDTVNPTDLFDYNVQQKKQM